jgi:hypothetical protein
VEWNACRVLFGRLSLRKGEGGRVRVYSAITPRAFNPLIVIPSLVEGSGEKGRMEISRHVVNIFGVNCFSPCQLTTHEHQP